mgnify:CR=1 FL=1
MLENNITTTISAHEQISMTETAANYFSEEFTEKNLNGFGVRMRVVQGDCNCNDYSYQMEYTNEAEESDMIFSSQGLSIICDPKSYPFLKGLVLDYSDDENSAGLRLINPNASKSCGCGSSFSV